MKVIDCVQGDAAWLDARHGKVTASRVADVISKGKKREDYKLELLTEILTGRTAEHFVTLAMDWGIQNEPVARSVYEIRNDCEIERIGLVLHETIDRAAASPDGLIGDDGLVEIKCPTTKVHLEYLLDDVIPERYVPQMGWQLACTGRSYCDFLSYDPRLPEDFSYFQKRLVRDEKYIEYLESAVRGFVSEIGEMALKLGLHAGKDYAIAEMQRREVGPGPERAVIPVANF